MVETLMQFSTLIVWLLTLFTVLNTKNLLACDESALINERVDVLLPARNEEPVIESAVRAALNQTQLTNFRVVVLNDASTDATGTILNSIHDDRLTVINSTEDPPAGWLGKPWACARLAEQSDAEILVFIDADVVLEPDAVACAITTMQTNNLHLVSPYPRQLATGILNRLIQPLLQWSWLTTVPLKSARSTNRASMAVANGQFLVCRRDDYLKAGGHTSVKGEVLDDINLLRSFYRQNLNGTVVDGSRIATCRMYESDQALVDGYAKSLWNAFGGPIGSIATCTLLFLLYSLPLYALVTTNWTYAMSALSAGVLGRVIVAQRTKQRTVPDVLLHSFSIIAFVSLNIISWYRHMRHRNSWKGRVL